MRYVFADCVLDTTLATLHRAGRAIPLWPKVFRLLQVLEAGVAHVRGTAPPHRHKAPILGDHLACPVPSPLRICAPPARCGTGGVWLGGGFAALTTCGRRRARGREGPVLFELLECPDPYTVGHTTSRDGGGFDRLEQFLPGSAVVDGSAHMGGHAILEAS